jgi:hypothetical protein
MSDEFIKNVYDLRLISDAIHRTNKAERRERIATACLAGLLADPNVDAGADEMSSIAVRFADALIARLDGEAQA